jgi:hypothetical protein
VTGTTNLAGLLTATTGVSSTLVTDATSSTTGSIITAGGISCQKALYVGTTANIAGAVTLTTPLAPASGGKPSNRYTNFTNTTVYTNNSVGALHAGFGSSFKITPSTTGNVRARISALLTCSGYNYAQARLRYGSGTAPATNAAATGTALLGNYVEVDGANVGPQNQIGATFEAELTGLTLSTSYWFDFTLNSVSCNGYVFPMSVVIEEF